LTALALTGAACFAAAQEQPTPAPAPTPAPTAPVDPAPAPSPRAPIAATEIHEFEIIEAPAPRSTQDAPQGPDAPDAPGARREIRIIDGDTSIWIDEGGDAHDLGEVMGQALEFNPEIRAIRAEIQALMARLEQLEMKTAADVVRKKVELRRLVDRQKALRLNDAPSPELPMLDADIAARKMELDYMLGARGDRPFGDQVRVMKFTGTDGPVLAPIAMRFGRERPGLEEAPEHIRTALDGERISLDFEDMELENVVSLLSTRMKLNVVLDTAVRSTNVNMNIKELPYGQAFLALAEANGLAFIIRDYGIFVTTRDRAVSIPGPSIPEGVPYSPRASATPTPTPVTGVWRGERVFKDGEHVIERRKPDGDAPKPEAPPASKER